MKGKKILAAALALCLLAACGGGESSSSSAPESSSGSGESQSSSQPLSRPDDAVDVIPLSDLPSRRDPVELIQFQEDYDGPIATIRTSMGDIRVVLYPQEAPKAVENFITHAKNGYYDGQLFHRVVDNFMIQGGSPSGTTAGGESAFEGGKPFEDEFSDNLHNFRGALSMANSGVNSNGSQFFIVQTDQKPSELDGENVMWQFAYNELERQLRLAEAGGISSEAAQYLVSELNALLGDMAENGVPEEMKAYYGPAYEKYQEVGGTFYLDYKHTVFGQVIQGMDVVDAIAKVEVNESDSKPLEDVVIQSITIEE